MKGKVLVIDNYDSFTFNLVQYLGELGEHVVVRRNDEVTAEQVEAEEPLAVVLSPGPRSPEQAGVSNELIRLLGPRLPMLGVCLGHECIGYVYGGLVRSAPSLMHGKVSQIFHEDDPLFDGLSNPFRATRYHSLALIAETVPSCLKVIAHSEDGTIMGIRHERNPVVGVQFHPESILTEGGHQLLKNFMEEARCRTN